MDNMAITGIGIVAGFADTIDALYGALSKGGFAGGAAPMPYIKKRHGLVFADDITKKLYAAFLKAMDDSGLYDHDESRAGIFLGNAQGSLDSIVNFEAKSIEKGYKAVLPMDFINTVMNAPAGQLAILSGFTGMNVTISDGSSASASAMAYCADMLGKNRVDIGVTGGFEAMSPLYEAYLRHFGAEPSDGVCVFITERESSAAERGAKIYAVWRGSAGAYFDDPSENEIYAVMTEAVQSSGLIEDEIDFIVNGCGACKTAVCEEEAAARFGCPCIDMSKVAGETYGASGAFAAAAAIAAIWHGTLPDGTPLKKNCRALINCMGVDGYLSSFVLESR